MAAQVAPIRAYLGKEWRNFGLLSAGQIAWLQSIIPGENRGLMIPSDVYRFGQTVDGAVIVIYESLVNGTPGNQVKKTDVAGWGSILQRQELAKQILLASMSSGEEEAPSDDPKAPVPSQSGTGGATPQ